MKEKEKHTKLGLYSVLIFGVFFFSVFAILKSGKLNRNIDLYLPAGDVEGLNTSNSILINGLQIGAIKDINLHNTSIMLKLSIDKNILIGKSAVFHSMNDGLFGNKIIDIKKHSESEKFYQNGDTIQSLLINEQSNSALDSILSNPAIKELSKDIGKALQEYGESK